MPDRTNPGSVRPHRQSRVRAPARTVGMAGFRHPNAGRCPETGNCGGEWSHFRDGSWDIRPCVTADADRRENRPEKAKDRYGILIDPGRPGAASFLRLPSGWRRHLQSKQANRESLWIVAVLFHLRDALRSGDVWLSYSRRYADLKQALVPIEAARTTPQLAVPFEPGAAGSPSADIARRTEDGGRAEQAREGSQGRPPPPKRYHREWSAAS